MHKSLMNKITSKCTHTHTQTRARTQRHTGERKQKKTRSRHRRCFIYVDVMPVDMHPARNTAFLTSHTHTQNTQTHKPSEVTSVHFTSPSVRSHAETLVQAASLEVNQGNQMCGACVRLNIWCVYNLGTHSVLAQTRDV